MRVLTVVTVLVLAMVMTVGCAQKREELPPLEPQATESAAPASMEKSPVVVESPMPPPARVKPIANPVNVPPMPPPAVTPGAIPATYTVQKGEGLMAIARKFYNDPKAYKKIYEANKDKIADPNNVKAGTVLTLPPK